MQTTKLQVKNSNLNYSIIIGKNIFSHIPSKIKILCPNAKKIALVVYSAWAAPLAYVAY